MAGCHNRRHSLCVTSVKNATSMNANNVIAAPLAIGRISRSGANMIHTKIKKTVIFRGNG
jgi:hypothetical protein